MRTVVFRRPDGSELLVTIYDSVMPPEVAERPSHLDSWGPPLDVVSDEEWPGS